MAAIESAVRKVMPVEMVTMSSVPSNPALPTTHPNRRYMMTPRIVRIDGVNTPPNVPRPPGFPDATTSSWSASAERWSELRSGFIAGSEWCEKMSVGSPYASVLRTPPRYSSGDVVSPTVSLRRFTPSTARTERVFGT